MCDLLKKYTEIDNFDNLANMFNRMTGKDLDAEIDFINQRADDSTKWVYFDEDVNMCGGGSPKAKYKALDTGFINKFDNKVIYISFYRKTTFEGTTELTTARIGSISTFKQMRTKSKLKSRYVVSGSNRYLKNMSAVEETEKPEATRKYSLAHMGTVSGSTSVWADVVDSLKNELMYCEHLLEIENGLSRYFRVICERAMRLVERHLSEEGSITDFDRYIQLNKEGTKVRISTGLLTKFGISVDLVLDIAPCEEGGKYKCKATNPVLVKEQGLLLRLGFDENTCFKNLERVPFYSSSSELIFDGRNLNLESYGSWEHCVRERRDRLPDEMKSMLEADIVKELKSAVEIAVKLNKCDYTFIKPYYDVAGDRICFAVPYYKGYEMTQEPEFYIAVVPANGDRWIPATLLTTEMAEFDVGVLTPFKY